MRQLHRARRDPPRAAGMHRMRVQHTRRASARSAAVQLMAMQPVCAHRRDRKGARAVKGGRVRRVDIHALLRVSVRVIVPLLLFSYELGKGERGKRGRGLGCAS